MRDYAPIACDAHDLLELLCLRGWRAQISWRNGDAVRTVIGRCMTWEAQGGVEHLVFETDREQRRLRLDHILEIQWHEH